MKINTKNIPLIIIIALALFVLSSIFYTEKYNEKLDADRVKAGYERDTFMIREDGGVGALFSKI